jgi:hypothetical protein
LTIDRSDNHQVTYSFDLAGKRAAISIDLRAGQTIAALVASDAVAVEMLEFNRLLSVFRIAVGYWEDASDARQHFRSTSKR